MPCGRTNFARSSPCLELRGEWDRCCCWLDWERVSAREPRGIWRASAKTSCRFTTAGFQRLAAANFLLASTTSTTRTISIFAIRSLCANATPIIYRGDLRLVSEYGSSNGYVDGSEPQFSEIRYQPIEQGRWLNWNDERERHNVCVIGSEFVRLLFPGRPVIGSRILINGVPFEVVGTLQKVGHGNNNLQNMRLIMPFTTMAIYFPMQGAGNAKAIKYCSLPADYTGAARASQEGGAEYCGKESQL